MFQILDLLTGLLSMKLNKICNMIFRKCWRGEEVKGRLELFRKFIGFGIVTRP